MRPYESCLIEKYCYLFVCDLLCLEHFRSNHSFDFLKAIEKFSSPNKFSPLVVRCWLLFLTGEWKKKERKNITANNKADNSKYVSCEINIIIQHSNMTKLNLMKINIHVKFRYIHVLPFFSLQNINVGSLQQHQTKLNKRKELIFYVNLFDFITVSITFHILFRFLFHS